MRNRALETMRRNAMILEYALAHLPPTDDARALLEKSLFYYCSGKDPTPIAAFGAKIPLYIYVDSFIFMQGSFEEETKTLYDRLEKLGFRLDDKRELRHARRWESTRKAELTLWQDGAGEAFLLLFVKGDAIKVFQSIYGDPENFVQPESFCNFRYELPGAEALRQAERGARNVLGYCFDLNFQCVGEFAYHGDWDDREACKVKWFQRVAQ